MTSGYEEKSIAIIGAGLVGGAVLRELVMDWINFKKAPNIQYKERNLEAAKYFETEKIFITAISESELIYQLQKTTDFVNQVDEVLLEKNGQMQLIVKQGSNNLSIDAEVLDILPIGVSTSNVEDETYRKKSALYTYLANKRPKTLVIGSNLAAIVAYTKELEETRTLVLAWILTTLKRAADELGIETVSIVGTTALGGQGTNMVWTHQSSQEMDSNLTSKILAAYGILGVLDRISWDTDATSRWMLLTPGSLLGYDYIDFGPVKYFSVPEGLPKNVEAVIRENQFSVPVYEPVGINLDDLSNEAIRWDERRLKNTFLSGAKVKCGETGDLTPLQFACISHAFQMGFNTDVYVAKILIYELMGKTTGYNQIPLGAGKVLEPTAQGQNERNLALERLAELELENGKRSPPVYPALGSPRAQKEIVLADLLYRLLSDKFGEPTLQQVCKYKPNALAHDLWDYMQNHLQLFSEITTVIPVISPSGEIYTGPHVMYLNKGIARTSDMNELTDNDVLRDFAVLGAVDLRAARDYIERKPKVYETGIEVIINRAQYITEKLIGAFSLNVVDRGGSAIDPRIRHWWTLTYGDLTIFDPVFFVIQFLGGERPFL